MKTWLDLDYVCIEAFWPCTIPVSAKVLDVFSVIACRD